MKDVLKAAALSIGVTLTCAAVNLFAALTDSILPLARRIPGGDCVEYIGFGVHLLEIFPMTEAGAQGVHRYYSFHPANLIAPLAVFALISFLLLKLIRRRKAKVR